MTDLHDQPEDATPLDPDEIEGLIPSHIVNREQLNALEQENIIRAQFWLNRMRFKKMNSEAMLRKLHQRMFGEVWRWAGTFRQTGKNIGVDAYQIAVELKNLCDDVDTWIEFSSYPNTEIAVRFHHRLVYIHLFPNGNGRHARLATDVLLAKQLNEPVFTWGLGSCAKGSLDKAGEIRSNYIKALRKADAGDYSDLMVFVSGT